MKQKGETPNLTSMTLQEAMRYSHERYAPVFRKLAELEAREKMEATTKPDQEASEGDVKS